MPPDLGFSPIFKRPKGWAKARKRAIAIAPRLKPGAIQSLFRLKPGGSRSSFRPGALQSFSGFSLEVFDRPPFSPSENYSVKLRYRRIMYLPLDFLSVWLLDILFCIFSAVGCCFYFFFFIFLSNIRHWRNYSAFTSTLYFPPGASVT